MQWGVARRLHSINSQLPWRIRSFSMLKERKLKRGKNTLALGCRKLLLNIQWRATLPPEAVRRKVQTADKCTADSYLTECNDGFVEGLKQRSKHATHGSRCEAAFTWPPFLLALLPKVLQEPAICPTVSSQQNVLRGKNDACINRFFWPTFLAVWLTACQVQGCSPYTTAHVKQYTGRSHQLAA